ncbi:hypothetical protein ATCC90586_005997 [Pythium insidiosum]|nr:hypothetical protein ATCC90586_005997 [Pythium insidiosum]
MTAARRDGDGDGDAWLLALQAWRQQRHLSELLWIDPSRSCAHLVVHVGHHGDDLDRCVRSLAELLALVALATRPGVDPLVLHRLSDQGASECPMRRRWCSFCDGVDRRVVLSLTPKGTAVAQTCQSFLEVVRRAVFEWSIDSTAPAAFQRLCARLPSQAMPGTQRSRPIELKIDVIASAGDVVYRDLELLLQRCAADAAVERGVAVSALHTMELDHRAMALVAASRVPVEIPLAHDWRSMLEDEQEDLDACLLARANVKSLHVEASWDESGVERLLEVLRAHSRELKELRLELDGFAEYDYDDEQDEQREAQMKTLGRALFGVESTLRLDKLELTAPISERDLELMISLFDATTPVATLRHKSVTLWGSELSTVQGATLGRLLTLSGGVDSLRVDWSGARVPEVAHLAQSCRALRSLTTATSCLGWKGIPLPSSLESDRSSGASVQDLELQLLDRKSSLIESALCRLLDLVGHSIVSLSILPRRPSAILKSDAAAAIVHRCPNLEQLRVRNADDSFVSRLVDLYAERPCKLQKLAFVTGDADAAYDRLMTALSTATNPIARVLRSLEVDVCGWRDNDVTCIGSRLQVMLKTNDTLHDVTLSAYETWPRDDEDKAKGTSLLQLLPIAELELELADDVCDVWAFEATLVIDANCDDAFDFLGLVSR